MVNQNVFKQNGYFMTYIFCYSSYLSWWIIDLSWNYSEHCLVAERKGLLL
jgi:hypothetical protein